MLPTIRQLSATNQHLRMAQDLQTVSHINPNLAQHVTMILKTKPKSLIILASPDKGQLKINFPSFLLVLDSAI